MGDDLRERAALALAAAGCIAPAAEADVLLEATADGRGELSWLLERRIAGEPLAWIVGWAPFGRLRVRVDPGVFVPRPQSEALAGRAAELLTDRGLLVDVCTGSGAIAMAVAASRPSARVLATDDDPAAIACARTNGVDAVLGDLLEPVPIELRGAVDVITGVVPYVPTPSLHLLPRDVLEHEPRHSLDGGEEGTTVLARVLASASTWLRPGGAVLLEIGGAQRSAMTHLATASRLTDVAIHRDEDGRDLVFEARRPAVS